MIRGTNRQRGLVGWCVSILLHLGLLCFGASLLIQHARFEVEAGKTSTEIEFAVEPVPLVAPPPARVAIPLPQARPVPTPEPVTPDNVPTPKLIVGPPPQSPVPLTKPQLSAHPTPRKAAPVQKSSNTSKGAIQAQPDDLHNEPPDYPEDSRAAREQGTVMLRVEVSAKGEPTAVTILKTSGYFRLDQAARRAVQHWKFHPAMTAGLAGSSEADVPVCFKLR